MPIIYLLTKKNDISNSVASYYNDDIVTVLDQNATENELTNSGAIRYAITIKNVYKFKALNYLENVEINELGKIYLQELMK